MDDYEDPRVQRLRAPRMLFERRREEGRCPQCGGKKEPFQVFCGAACTAKAEAHEPPLPETEEEKTS